jgi:hypothetical protein
MNDIGILGYYIASILLLIVAVSFIGTLLWQQRFAHLKTRKIFYPLIGLSVAFASISFYLLVRSGSIYLIYSFVSLSLFCDFILIFTSNIK